jgi:stage III sporulation protein AF
MALLAEIVRNVLVIIIIASFLELLLPVGSTRPFVRFAIGLFVLIAVLNPVLVYLFDNKQFSVNLWDYQIDDSITEAIEEHGREINQKITAQNQAQYEDKITGQISSVAQLVPGVEKVEAEVEIDANGTVSYVLLNVTLQQSTDQEDSSGISVLKGELFDNHPEPVGQESVQRKITDVISNMYGIKSEQIEIKFKGG